MWQFRNASLMPLHWIIVVTRENDILLSFRTNLQVWASFAIIENVFVVHTCNILNTKRKREKLPCVSQH